MNLPAKTKYIDIDEAVAEVLSNQIECDGVNLKIVGTRLDAKLYKKVDAVLQEFGGKWNRKSQSHIFPSSPMEAIQAAIDEGKVLNKKQSFQYFSTPEPLARKLVELAEVKAGNRVLEPSAGSGALLKAIKETQPLARLCWVELDESHGESLRSIQGSGYLGVDFLTMTEDALGKFDKIIMNPPFSSGQDGEHVQHAYKFLKSGGLLASIVGEGSCYRQDKKARAFQEFVEENKVHEEKLARDVFKESGTLSASRIIVLKK